MSLLEQKNGESLGRKNLDESAELKANFVKFVTVEGHTVR